MRYFTEQLDGLIDGVKVGGEEVGIVVASVALGDRDDPFQTHSCVDALLGEELQLSTFPPSAKELHAALNQSTYRHGCSLVKLHEDNVPNLQTSGSSMLTSSGTSLSPIRSKWISEHGPQGPISQKLSFMPNGRTR